MARSSCSSCGLRSQHCQCRREASTAGIVNGDDGERVLKLTPVSFCVIYLVLTSAALGFIYLLLCLVSTYYPQRDCHLEVFVDSFSVSNFSTANATDWNVGFAAKSPGNGCKVSLHMIQSRLLHGDKLISELKTPDYFGQLVTGKIYESGSFAIYKTVGTPIFVGNGVIWDLRVEVVFTFTIKYQSSYSKDGYLIVACEDIPLNLTADPAGYVKGSLLGSMRPCEYLFREEYKDTSS